MKTSTGVLLAAGAVVVYLAYRDRRGGSWLTNLFGAGGGYCHVYRPHGKVRNTTVPLNGCQIEALNSNVIGYACANPGICGCDWATGAG